MNSEIKLTEKQIEGIKIAKRRYNEGEDYTCISGYAGTGKSTLVKFLSMELGLDQEDIAYACFTGKASLVLQRKGHSNAMTLHRLLYNSFKRPDGTFAHIPKQELDKPYKLIVVDEISMVPKQIWLQVLKHGVHIFALGDPFQLPPIGEDNGVLANPHIFLDEVMRQALESDIIKLSMDIRNGKQLQVMNGNDVKVINSSDLVSGMYIWADQIICGKNATRRMINSQMRTLLGKGSEPEVGDKIICLKNYWDIENSFGDPLINGMIGNIKNVSLGQDEGIMGKKMLIDFTPDFVENHEAGSMSKLSVGYKLITSGVPTMAKNAKPVYFRGKMIKPPLEFDYGYCITCHKSQGSQFSKILLFEEVLSRETHSRWLYTAITRAISKIVIVKA